MDIIPIQTGTVRIKPSQVRAVGHGDERIGHIFGDAGWTPELPILAWAIMHPDGVILVDSGETPRAMEPGWYPAEHPYYANAIKINIPADQGIVAQLKAHGIAPRDIQAVLLTHLHTDHVGGLNDFEGARVWVHATEFEQAQGEGGLQRGYLPHRFPQGFAPSMYKFDGKGVGPFARSHRVTKSGDVSVVETPGHTGGHVSVVVRDNDAITFIAGDATYAEDTLLDRVADGISPDEPTSLETLARINAFLAGERAVYLPSHDPRSAERLRTRRVTKPRG